MNSSSTLPVSDSSPGHEKIDAARRILREIASLYSPAALACAFGPESLVLLDLIVLDKLAIEPFCLDTLRLYDETYQVHQAIEARYGITVHMVNPDPEEVDLWVGEHGLNGFYRSPALRKRCCELRKSLPLRRYLRRKKSWVTGLRHAQSHNRSEMDFTEWDTEHGIYKFNPLIEWTDEDVWGYIRDRELPYNRLHDRGYSSIGCEPCTRAIRPGEDRRAGRWWWETNTQKECGIHVTKSENAETTDVRTTRKGANRRSGMRILVLGGDGFCGWPTALHLSAQGHDVAIVDNLSRRKIDIELECESLTPIRPMSERLAAWKEVSGRDIVSHRFDVSRNYQWLLDLLQEWKPDAIVHFAEQRAAP